MFRSKFFADSGFGDNNFNGQTIPGQSFMGELRLQQSKVTGAVTILGNVHASGSELQKVDITGEFTSDGNTQVHGALSATGNIQASETTFAASVEAVGDLNASKSVFAENISLVSGETALKDSTLLKGITFNDDGRGSDVVLRLENTTINGDITFHGSNGIIIKDEATVIHGRVSGAKNVVDAVADTGASAKARL